MKKNPKDIEYESPQFAYHPMDEPPNISIMDDGSKNDNQELHMKLAEHHFWKGFKSKCCDAPIDVFSGFLICSDCGSPCSAIGRVKVQNFKAWVRGVGKTDE